MTQYQVTGEAGLPAIEAPAKGVKRQVAEILCTIAPLLCRSPLGTTIPRVGPDQRGESVMDASDRTSTERRATSSPASQGARLTIEDLSITYQTRHGTTNAVEAVAMDVPAGSFVTVIGPSGCGKSSLLNAIAGFLAPSAGRVLVDGAPVRGPGPDRAVVHQQSAALLPWLNVEDNVGLALRARRLLRGECRAIVDRYLLLVGLSDFARHAIYEISGGMQQRVALARALAAESPIVLLDEPLGALDALQRQLMQDFLLDIWGKTRRTFFLITHSVEEAVYLSTEVLVMSPRPGRILERETLAFGGRALAGEGAAIKTTPEFVTAQARLLARLMSLNGIHTGETP